MSSRHGDGLSHRTEGEIGIPFRWDSESALLAMLSSRFRSKKLNRLGGGVVAENSAPCVFQIPTLTCMAPSTGAYHRLPLTEDGYGEGGGWEAKAVDEQRGWLASDIHNTI